MSHPRVRPGPWSRSFVVLFATALLGVLLPLPGPASAATASVSPLTVRLSRLSPAVIPAKGNLVLAGSVVNSSDQNWIGVNVHPFISSEPMTTRDELAAAAATDPAADVGNRLTDPGQFTPVGDMAPGQRAAFKIVLPVKDLPISRRNGVYWIGVHALGQATAGGRSVLGRARTFIPLVGAGTPSTSVALVVPVRAAVRRDPAGRLLNTSVWSSELAPNGRLGRIAAFAASAGQHPVTLLLDPSVLDAVGDLVDDNPAISLGKATRGTQSPSPSPSPSESADPTGSPSRSATRPDAGDRATASTWLSEITTAARRHSVLGLGYADPDVAALIRQGSPLYALSNRLAAQTFSALKIAALPTVAPPDGWLEDAAVARLPASTTVLVSDHAAPRTRTLWRTSTNQDLVITDQQAANGGPGPTAPLDALALRQRIVAEAALRTGEHANGPLVVELPANWDPGSGWQLADFFDALDQPWLDQVALNPTADTGIPTFGAALGYPAAQRALEIPVPNVTAARKLTQTATALSELLQSDNDVAHDLAGAALGSVSVHARADEINARVQVLATNDHFQGRMAQVEVLGTDFVTLSGGSGTLAITLVNGLDQPVLVGVQPRTSSGAVTVAATRPVKMAAGERTVLRLKATASSIGVTRVVLTPVTGHGTEVGTPLAFSLRTSQVGKTIWFVLAAGAALLVVMILRRVRRGLTEHRWKGRG